ncbi:MAG: FAD-dependent oxidoreductase, partial [Acetobacteraceae bacterium]|nr:FAD-dependent oxidoreductase [Acetobacteraceae bacterium]
MRVIVIGGGILGASTAFHLAQSGAEVVLVDAAHDGRATAAGAGIVCPWLSGAADPDWYRIANAGARYLPGLVSQLAEQGERDVGHRRVGALAVAWDEAELDLVERLARSRAAEETEAGPVSRLAPPTLRRLFPPLHPDLSAVHVAGADRVDGRRLSAALLRAAGRRGAEMHAGRAELLAEGGRIKGVRTGAERFAADAVVVAAGAWAPALLAPLGLSLSVEPQRGQIAHLRLEGVETDHWPVVLPPGSHYLLAFERGLIVAGATRELGVGFDYRVTAGGQAEVLNQALAVAPGLASASLIETRVGFRPL